MVTSYTPIKYRIESKDYEASLPSIAVMQHYHNESPNLLVPESICTLISNEPSEVVIYSKI